MKVKFHEVAGASGSLTLSGIRQVPDAADADELAAAGIVALAIARGAGIL